MVKRKTTIVQSEVVENAADAGQAGPVVADEAPNPAGAEESTMVTAEDADEKREEGEEEEGEELEYTIEKILKERIRKGAKQFLVKWLGWDEVGDDTWEPLEHVEETVQYEEWLKSQEQPKKEKESGSKPAAGEEAPAGTPKKRKSPQPKQSPAGAEGEALSEAKLPKKQKKKRDPTLPKGPLTAYLFFANEHRASIKEANPSFTLGEIGRELGERWRKATPEDKEPFLASQAADKERYDKEMAAHKASAADSAQGAEEKADAEEPADVEATEVQAAAPESEGVVAVEVRPAATEAALATSTGPAEPAAEAGIPA